ncbi:MAG: domain containing protein [Bacteroidetes bacterium]|jgi:gliding motility-associated-like protein|nr:domain containing protein [Bacteroidota bacterium]
MKKSKKILIPFLFLLLAFAPAMKAQIDTVFWFAAPWATSGHGGNTPIYLRISTFSTNTTVRIQQPAGTFDTTFVVTANSLLTYSLSPIVATLVNNPANTILDRGLKISSNFPITVVYEVANGPNPETYSLKGQNGLGKEFVTPFQTRWDNGNFTPTPKSMFIIVATEDNTTVWITPRGDIIGHPAGQTFSIILNKGQSYNCENTTRFSFTNGNNLSGSIVVSDKPVAVTVSDDSVDLLNGTCRDMMGDQIVPTDVIGREYIVNKGGFSVAAQEGFFVVAVDNFTSIQVFDGVTTTNILLNQGETQYYMVTQPLTHVIADKPVYMYQASGFGCEIGGAILPPLNCSGSNQVNFARTNAQTFLINILCAAGDEGAFTLNGNPGIVTAASFTVVPGTGGQWMGAQVNLSSVIAVGAAQLLVNTNGGLFSLGVINGGSSTDCLFHYMSSFIRRVYTTAGTDQVLCSGLNPVNLAGNVTGGSTTGIWTILNGTGTLADSSDFTTTYQPSSSDTAQGTVTFVLASTGNCDPVTDTVQLTFQPNPRVNAGADQIRCENNLGTISVSGFIANAVGSNWTSTGTGGSFNNSGALNTTYSPSVSDVAGDSISLVLTTAGSIFGCPNVSDTLKLYFTPAPVVDAGINTTVCANNAVINLNGLVNGTNVNGIWSTTGSGLISPNDTILTGATYSPSSTDTTLGVVIIHLTSTNNGICNSVVDSITITIIDAPSVDVVTNDTLCGNINTITLNANVSSGFPVSWTTGGSGSFTNPNSANTDYTINPLDTAAGYVLLTLTTVPGICNAVSDTLHLVFADPPFANAGIDQAFCSNDVIPLNGVVTGVTTTGVWTSTGTGSFNPGANQLTTFYTPSALDVSTGVDLILTTTNNQGCNPDVDVLSVTFKQPPIAEFSVNEVCMGLPTSFTDASVPPAPITITGWDWNYGDLITGIAQNPIHNYPGAGTYTATLIAHASNGCSDTVQHVVTVNILPNPEFSNSTACQGNVTSFFDQSVITQGTIQSWEYAFGDQTPNSTVQNPTHIFSGNGFYPVTLTVTSDKGCEASIMHNINVLGQPQAYFGFSSNPALAGESITFNDISAGGPVSWNWNFGDTTGTNEQNPAHIYASGGSYNVVLTIADQYGCTDSISRELIVAMLPVLPTAFTPNSDLQNDVFYVRGGPFKNILLKVYNNWGEIIFTSDKQEIGWDGKHRDVDQPMGVYVWYVEVEVADGRIFKKSGDVTLIR